MSVYEKIEKKVNSFLNALYLFRTEFGEKQAIKRKKSFVSDVNWTEEQKKEFKEYWIKNYGEEIPSDWHKMYQKISGVWNVDYFPEYLFSTKLEPLLNPKEYCKIFANKSILYSLYSDVEGIKIPKMIISNCFGNFFDTNLNPISKEKSVEILNNIGVVLFKATIDSSGGKSITIADFENGIDKKSGLSAKEIIANYKENFVVQEKIIPSDTLRLIYPNALSTFRIITYLTDDHIGHCPVAMRMGVGTMEVDNITSGGLCIGVDDNGQLGDFATNTRYGEGFDTRFSEHPNTKTKFSEIVIPQIPKMIELAKEMHKKTPQIGIISWDLSVDNNENVILIEANFYEQSAWFPQIINGKPLFGDDTKYMLNLIR